MLVLAIRCPIVGAILAHGLRDPPVVVVLDRLGGLVLRALGHLGLRDRERLLQRLVTTRWLDRPHSLRKRYWNNFAVSNVLE